MIFALILALAVGVGCYFGCYRLGVWTINHGYMAPDAVELHNQRHERSLQQYVASNNVSSRDTVAIEQWLRSEKNASVIVYQAEGDPCEAGTWGTSQLLDDTTPKRSRSARLQLLYRAVCRRCVSRCLV